MTGDDFVRGGEGDDTLISHGGADTIFGDTGDDVLDGRESAQASNGRGLFEDSLTAGSGDDLIYADDGDRVSAGKGADTIHADLTVGAASGVAWDAARDWAPIQLSDFDPAEDLLIIDLPDHEPLGLQDMRYTGTNGDEITLVLGGYQLATLSGVRFEDLGSTNFALR
jgi:Ca2+-binding RTX toxin-like protein